MLSFNLTPIFRAKGIERPFAFLVKAGFSNHAAHLILNSTSRSFKLDHVELLCKVLICEPNDLLLYVPDKNQQYSPDHPLQKLQQQPGSSPMKETFATIPYHQLKEITKQLNTPS